MMHVRSATQINFKTKDRVTFGAKELGHIRRSTLLNLSQTQRLLKTDGMKFSSRSQTKLGS